MDGVLYYKVAAKYPSIDDMREIGASFVWDGEVQCLAQGLIEPTANYHDVPKDELLMVDVIESRHLGYIRKYAVYNNKVIATNVSHRHGRHFSIYHVYQDIGWIRMRLANQLGVQILPFGELLSELADWDSRMYGLCLGKLQLVLLYLAPPSIFEFISQPSEHNKLLSPHEGSIQIDYTELSATRSNWTLDAAMAQHCQQVRATLRAIRRD